MSVADSLEATDGQSALTGEDARCRSVSSSDTGHKALCPVSMRGRRLPPDMVS
eukprot:COSAG02_NODE_958_length_15648_cov_5.487620_11_plen_53_part_00